MLDMRNLRTSLPNLEGLGGRIVDPVSSIENLVGGWRGNEKPRRIPGFSVAEF
jgi:hypothetical protein